MFLDSLPTAVVEVMILHATATLTLIQSPGRELRHWSFGCWAGRSHTDSGIKPRRCGALTYTYRQKNFNSKGSISIFS